MVSIHTLIGWIDHIFYNHFLDCCYHAKLYVMDMAVDVR